MVGFTFVIPSHWRGAFCCFDYRQVMLYRWAVVLKGPSQRFWRAVASPSTSSPPRLNVGSTALIGRDLSTVVLGHLSCVLGISSKKGLIQPRTVLLYRRKSCGSNISDSEVTIMSVAADKS